MKDSTKRKDITKVKTTKGAGAKVKETKTTSKRKIREVGEINTTPNTPPPTTLNMPEVENEEKKTVFHIIYKDGIATISESVDGSRLWIK